jgi:hypothetical protein
MPSTTVGDKLCTSTVFPMELELHVRATVESEMENSLPFYACWNRDLFAGPRLLTTTLNHTYQSTRFLFVCFFVIPSRRNNHPSPYTVS